MFKDKINMCEVATIVLLSMFTFKKVSKLLIDKRLDKEYGNGKSYYFYRKEENKPDALVFREIYTVGDKIIYEETSSDSDESYSEEEARRKGLV